MNSTARGVLVAMAAGALWVAAQTASAQLVNGCPAGQAMQSSDASGRNVTCVPIPNVSALQAADTQLQRNIEAEANSRAGMDATLLQAIQDETRERKTADDELRAGLNETSVAGRYAFSGPFTCISSSTGFNADFTPRNPTPGAGSAFIQVQNGIRSGFRTFNEDGTGTAEIYTQNVSHPGVFYTTFINPDGTVFNSAQVAFNGAAPRPSGNASASRTSGAFTWQLVDGQVLIADADGNSGTVSEGSGAGTVVSVRGLPTLVGVLGHDRRTISFTHQKLQVEIASSVLADGTVRDTQRICVRERLLRKL